MWQGIIADLLQALIFPVVAGGVVAIFTSRREDRRHREAITTPTYDALLAQLSAEQAQLSAEQDARGRLRVDLSTLRDERDRLARDLGDWQDWGHDLVRDWATVRTHPEPPNCPDRSNT